MTRSSLDAAALATVLLAGACSGGQTAHGTTSGSRPDSGSGDAGSGGCHYDVDCAAVHGTCAPDGGCVPATEICNPSDPDTGVYGCGRYGNCVNGADTPTCYCHPDHTSDAGGFCYHPLPPCAACHTSLDCGNDRLLATLADCLPLDGGDYCLPLDFSGCGEFPGFVVGLADGGGTGLLDVCVPVCDTCPCGNSGCKTNADCPSLDAGICGLSKICTAPCMTQTDCPPNQVCNVLDKYLDPRLTLSPATAALYGAGQCGIPCDGGSACAGYQSAGGAQLSCITDPTESNGKRCRLPGCQSDAECAQAGTSPYVPWCDAFNGNQCITDACRVGRDDCEAPTTCQTDGGQSTGPSGAPATGRCVAKPCTEQGGEEVACGLVQFCCGEGDAGVSSCPSGVSFGDCYPAPDPPWCTSCDPARGSFGDAVCNAPSARSYGSGVGASVCAGDTGLCEPACSKAVPYSCPTGFSCEDEEITVASCAACGANPCQTVSGRVSCGCVDSLGTGCPGNGELAVFAEAPGCEQCPRGGDAGCATAPDDAGVYCGCAKGDDDLCPATSIGELSYPSLCAPGISGQLGCGLLTRVTCTESNICSVGSFCVTQRTFCDESASGTGSTGSTGGSTSGGSSGTGGSSSPPDTIGTSCNLAPSCPLTAPQCVQGPLSGLFYCTAFCDMGLGGNAECAAVGSPAGTPQCNTSTANGSVCGIACGQDGATNLGSCPDGLTCSGNTCQ